MPRPRGPHNPYEDPSDATLNLLGPIVVNRFTLEAAQVVLSSSGYSVRAPLAVAG